MVMVFYVLPEVRQNRDTPIQGQGLDRETVGIFARGQGLRAPFPSRSSFPRRLNRRRRLTSNALYVFQVYMLLKACVFCLF